MTIIASDKFSQPAVSQLSQVKHIVLVASGKGGVGKSTTAVNLAVAMAAIGARVGLMDADIYGPSQPTMLGICEDTRPTVIDDKYMQPITRYGVKAMSVGFLAAEKTPMVWRGAMAVKAMQQLLEQTLWGELDYLFVDMPPGTGDIHISMAQNLPVSGAVVVTTPQEVALLDARKGIEMFRKVQIPLLGLIENMAVHECVNCGHQSHIFGTGGVHRLQAQYNVPLLASLPLDPHIRSDLDRGHPSVAARPADAIAREYLALAAQVAAQLRRLQHPADAKPEIRIVE